MNPRGLLISIALLFAVVVVVAIVWLLNAPSQRARPVPRELVTGTNPAMNLRYQYDAAVLAPAPYDDRAEYPLRLDGDGFSFYGKRLKGVGRWLAKDPAPVLYDFVAQEHVETYEQWFGLEPAAEPLYEDATISGRLGIHQQLAYRRTESSLGWPSFFPGSVTGGLPEPELQTIEEYRRRSVSGRLYIAGGSQLAYIEGWAVFSDTDLFFFQTVSPAALSSQQREACELVLSTLEFNALLDETIPPEPTEQPALPELPEIDLESASPD